MILAKLLERGIGVADLVVGIAERIGDVGSVWSAMLKPVAGVIVAVIAARFAWVFATDIVLRVARLVGLKRLHALGWRHSIVLGWTGMRGVVTLAIALALPEQMPGRDLMLVTAFAVIFVTVIVQGTSLGWLVGKVRPVDLDPPAMMDLPSAEAAIAAAKAIAVEAHAYDADGVLVHPQLLEQYRKRLEVTNRYATNADAFMENLGTHFDVILAAIESGRAELIRIHRKGLIEDEVLHDLEHDLDVEELGIVLQRGS